MTAEEKICFEYNIERQFGKEFSIAPARIVCDVKNHNISLILEPNNIKWIGGILYLPFIYKTFPVIFSEFSLLGGYK